MTKGARIAYSAAEMLWLEANRSMIISDYHRAFCAAFGRANVTAAHLHGLRKRKGWKVGRSPGRFANRHMKFTAAEIAWLRENCTMVVGEYHKTFCAEFDRTDMSAVALNALRKRKGWKTGRTGHFDKGSVPWSKGKKLPFNPIRALTQFKAGQLPHNTKFAGHERPHKNGYLYISVKEPNPHTGFERRYVLKHRWLWEQSRGPIPDGMCLKCLSDDVANADPSNWELIPRGMLPRLNGKSRRGYDDAPAELKPTIMAVAKLEHQVSQKTKRA